MDIEVKANTITHLISAMCNLTIIIYLCANQTNLNVDFAGVITLLSGGAFGSSAMQVLINLTES